jgi:hypothetical protein
MAPLRLANNALDDPTNADSAVAISRLWQRCSTLGAEQCSGVPPIGCSAFNRQGERYEVELDGLGCVRCPTPLEVIGLAGAGASFVLLFVLFVRYFTRYMRKYPEHAKTHVASFLILVGHLQTLTIIGRLQLGWPLIIQEILASINLPLISYIPVPCILTDPVLKALLSYAETAIVLLLLLRAWLVAWRRREAATRAEDKREEAQKALEAGMAVAPKAKAKVLVKALLRAALLRMVGRCRSVPQEVAADATKDAAKAKAAADKAAAAAAEAEYFLSVLFSFLFTVGLRASVTLFMRYDEDQTRLAIARLVASLLWLFWLFLLWRFHWLLRKAREAAREAEKLANSGAQTRVRLRRRARRAAEAVRYLTQRYASDDGLSHGDFLLWAEKQIDGPIRERLADGTIRLLRCAWLLSKDSDKHLGRDASGRVVMRRRQELEIQSEEAFFTKEEAVELLDRADRSILAISYRWLTALHPDPHGTALFAVRGFLRSEAGLGKCGMFWDFASLPQKDKTGGPRTAEEKKTFDRGIEAMGCFYASMCGTVVVQLKDIPPRPSEYDGRMIVFDEKYSEKTSEKDVVADLERFGGHITKIAIKAGEAHVTFAMHEQAERCIAALDKDKRGACTVYNETAYSRDRGEPFSGWCTFEQGSSKLAAAHLNMASRQASKRSTVLPERLKHANASRAKVIDISDGQVRTVDVKESPATLLKQTNLDLEIAKFVGKGESETVKQLLAKLEWSMNLALDLATADHARKSDDGPKSASEGGVPTDSKAICAWWWPLRSQWQLVVWARHGLLFLVSFAMDCVMWFSPYEAHRSARYVFATLAIAVLGGFCRLQAWRQPYAKRGQHWLETFLYAVDILAIVLACVYGALTNDDGTVQDGLMRRALELGLGALLGASVLFAALVVGLDIMRERWYIRQWFLDATQFFDVPVVDAIRDGAVRLIDYAWLLDSKRSDGQLPHVTKVVARLASNEPTSVALIRRLATHCGTSSICITVEAASAASPPPSPPEVAALAEVQLEDRSSARHMTRLRKELAEAGLSQLAHAIIKDLGIESVEGLREFTFDELKGHLKAEAGVALTARHVQKLKAFLAASPSGTSEGRMPGGPKVAFSAPGLQQDAKMWCNTKHADAKLVRSRTVKAMTSAQVKKSEAGEGDVESPHLDTSSAARSPGSGASGRFHSRRGRDSFAEDLTMEAASKSEHPSGRKTRRDLPTASPLPRPAAVGSGRMDHNHGIVLQDLDSRPAPRKKPTLLVTFHLSTFDEVIPLTAASLLGKAEAVKERLAELGAVDIEIVTGKPFLPRCQDMPAEAFLSPERAAELFEQGRRGVDVVSYCRRSPGVPDPDGRTLEKILGHAKIGRGADGDRGLFVDFACVPQIFAWPSWHAPEAVPLRFGSRSSSGPDNGHFVDQGPLTVLKFECDRVDTEDEAQVCVDQLVALCEEQKWALASMADFKSLGLQSRGHASVLFHGRYISGVYHFDEGADAEGYIRLHTAGDAKAARQDPKLKRMCGGKEPKLMGEHVFENELKSRRALSVMGSLYASATGTCVLQLTDPPGELGKEVAPDELVSERTGTVFVVEVEKELGDKSLDELQKVLQEELQMEIGDELLEEPGDGVLACEKKGRGEVVVRVLGERAARAVRSLNERGYPLRRKDRVVYPMYNLRPYGSRGWPTFEMSAASMVLAHITQHKRRGGAQSLLFSLFGVRRDLPPPVAQAEASGPKRHAKLVNIDVIGAPSEVVVTQSPEHLLRECKKNLRSNQIFFNGKADRKDVVQLLSDFKESIAVKFDHERAKLQKLRTEDLAQVITEAPEARRSRSRKEQGRLTVHEERTPILHVPEPTHILHVVPEAALATKYPELKPTEGTAAPSPQARSPSTGAAAAPPSKMSVRDGPPSSPPAHLLHQIPAAPLPKPLSGSKTLTLQLKPNEKVGMTVVDSNKVVGVDPDSPASKAGLRAGDLILAVDGVECTEGVTALKLWKDGAGRPVRKLRIMQGASTPEPKPTVANEYRRAPGKPMCRYGTACTRKNPFHFQQQDHPSDHPLIARGGAANDDHLFDA